MLLWQTYRSQLRSPDRKYRPKADIHIDTSGLGPLIVVRFPGRRQRDGPSVCLGNSGRNLATTSLPRPDVSRLELQATVRCLEADITPEVIRLNKDSLLSTANAFFRDLEVWN